MVTCITFLDHNIFNLTLFTNFNASYHECYRFSGFGDLSRQEHPSKILITTIITLYKRQNWI